MLTLMWPMELVFASCYAACRARAVLRALPVPAAGAGSPDRHRAGSWPEYNFSHLYLRVVNEDQEHRSSRGIDVSEPHGTHRIRGCQMLQSCCRAYK